MSGTVTASVVEGTSVDVPWFQGMNAQDAIESAYDSANNPAVFTYTIQYYGAGLGYLVAMINETYESFISSADPFFFWEFLVNGTASQTGIDNTILNDGDEVSFELQMYDATAHAKSTVKTKHEARTTAGKR